MDRNSTVTTTTAHGMTTGQVIYVSGVGAPRNLFKRIIWRAANAMARSGNRLSHWATRQKFTISQVNNSTTMEIK